ncbi:MAG: glycosyltransferase family 4 protein [Verrucomicrobiota bacterium]
MKVLFVHERFGALAGAEANAYLTAAEFTRRGHTVGILHGPTTGKAEAAWKEAFSMRFALSGGNYVTQVKSAVDTFQPEILYVHKMAGLEVIEALIQSGVPVVRMVHDHDIYCMRSYKYHYFSRKICTRAAGLYCVFPCGAFLARNHEGGFPLKLVNYVAKKKEIHLNKQFQRMIVVTHYMKDELLRNGFSEDKIEIHPPVPIMGDPLLRSNFSDRNLIVYAGQIIRGKGVDILLHTLSRLTIPFECIIFGDGSHRPYCEKLCRRLKLDDRVQFMGFVPQEELKNVYRECSVMAISSVWPEPFATIGMEAMSYGIPVVAFDAGGIKDWLLDGQNGFLVPWMDCGQFAARLEQLLKDKSLARQMGQRGLKLVEEKFSFSQYILNLEKTFQKVVDESRIDFLPDT